MQNIKYCPQCNQTAQNSKNTFCPYDGTPLIEMQSVDQPQSKQIKPTEVQQVQFAQNKVIQLDCNACKTPNSMTRTKVAKFSSVVRFIGQLLLIPSFLGIAFAILVFMSFIFVTIQIPNSNNEAEKAGQAIGLGISILFSVTVGIISLVGGLVGWLLLLNRNVYKCQRCGFIIERA